MISHRAEEHFRNGCRHLEAGDPRTALGLFKTAVELEKIDLPGDERQARYLSYYGLCLCFTTRGGREAMQCCREAAKREAYRPEIWWNLGRVALSLGRRGEAYRALQNGLKLQPGHRGMVEDLARLGQRRPPALSFLSRRHPANVILGKLRAKLTSGQTTATPRHRRVDPAMCEGQQARRSLA